MGHHQRRTRPHRRHKTVHRQTRRLLELRDQGCAFPGCDRPPSWCDGHHTRSWLQGGPTTPGNGVLLCGYHHRLIHRGEWTVRIADDGNQNSSHQTGSTPIATPFATTDSAHKRAGWGTSSCTVRARQRPRTRARGFASARGQLP
ncbi:MAG: HNH endonuclease [Actinopolymorphaceae bacterium]